MLREYRGTVAVGWERGRRSEGQGTGDGDNELGFGLSNVFSSADLLNFPGRKEHLPAAPPPPNVSGRKEQDLFCQCSLQ